MGIVQFTMSNMQLHALLWYTDIGTSTSRANKQTTTERQNLRKNKTMILQWRRCMIKIIGLQN